MTTQNTTTDDKSIVQQAMAAFVATGDVEALAPLLSEDFVHHRPDATFATKAEWLDDLSTALVPLADQQVEIRHLLADGDHVVIHSQRRLPGGGPEIAVVDIWRLHDGLIAEGWEIIEPVAQAAANMAWWEPTDR